LVALKEALSRIGTPKGKARVIAIRTAVVTMSPMLRDIVMKLPTRSVGLVIVAEFDTRTLLEDRLKAVLPDIVLIGLARGETDRIAKTVLAAVPHSRVIAFSSGVRRVYIHEMRPHRTALSNASAQAIRSALSLRHRRGRI
jgi:hypothetical protein